MIFGTFAIVLPYQEAEAGHTQVVVAILIFKDGNFFKAYGAPNFPCGEECDASLDLNKRDEKRFERWCGSNPFSIVVPADTTQLETTCEGEGPWEMIVRVQVLHSHTLVNHSNPITVHVEAT